MSENDTGCRNETKHDGPSIDVSASVYERFEEEREKTKTDHVPPMDESTFLSALLDTYLAVEDGYYERSADLTESGGDQD